MLNVHALGGGKMLLAARKAIPAGQTKLIAVTLLTSMGPRDLLDIGINQSPAQIVQHLASSHEVDLVTFASEAVAEERVAAMRRYCRFVAPVLYEEFEPHRLKALLGFFSRRPRSVVDTYCVEMARIIERLATDRSFDVVIASQIDMVPYAMDVSGVPGVFEEAEIKRKNTKELLSCLQLLRIAK